MTFLQKRRPVCACACDLRVGMTMRLCYTRILFGAHDITPCAPGSKSGG